MESHRSPAIRPLEATTLLTAPVGKKMQLHALNSAPEVCQRLREMGFCESAQVIKLSSGKNLICQVCGVRLALSRDLGNCILLRPVETSALPANKRRA